MSPLPVLVEQQRQIPCYAGTSNLVLDESGEVYACEMLPVGFGNVRDHKYDISQVVNTPQAREVIDSIKSNHCYCTHECYMMTNTLLNPRLYPQLAREYISLV